MAAVLGGCHGDSVLLYCAASSPSLQSFHRDCLRSRRTLDMICTNSSDYIIGKLYDMFVCHNQNPILALIPSLPKLYHRSKTGGIFEIVHSTFEIIPFINTG